MAQCRWWTRTASLATSCWPAGHWTFADLRTPTSLAAVKAHADGVGPWKPHLVTTVNDGIDRNGDGERLQTLVDGAIGRACSIGFPPGFKRVLIKECAGQVGLGVKIDGHHALAHLGQHPGQVVDERGLADTRACALPKPKRCTKPRVFSTPAIMRLR